MKYLSLGVFAFSLLTAAAAQAAPVMLSYSGIVSGSLVGLPTGVSAGDTISYNVTADNGFDSLLSQSWSTTDILSASISVGEYSATATGPTLGYGDGFATDSYGDLILLSFGTLQLGTDTGGITNIYYYMNGANDIWYASDGGTIFSVSIGAVGPPTIANTRITMVSAVPLPAALPLYSAGLAVMGFIGWRRKRKAAA